MIREPAHVFRIKDGVTDPLHLNSFKMKLDGKIGELNSEPLNFIEFGQAVTLVAHDGNEAEVMKSVALRKDEFLQGLIDHCKVLAISHDEVKVMPRIDPLARFASVGWYLRVASPEIDFFKKFFACNRQHVVYQPRQKTKLSDCWKIFRQWIKDLRHFEEEDPYEW